MSIGCHICNNWTRENGCDHYNGEPKALEVFSAIKLGGDSDGLKTGIIHILESNSKAVKNKAICGTKPASNSNGWHIINREPSCKNCISKLKELIKQ